MSDTSVHVRFPSASFVSFAEFEEYSRDMQPRLDARYLYELGLASKDESILRDGTCAPCLRRARFIARTAGGQALDDGRLLPNWREELVCDCEDRLNNRNRATLHFLLAVAGLRGWSRVLLFGPPGAADRRIAAQAGFVASVPRAGRSRPGYRIDAADAAFHLVVSSDYLHCVPPLEPVLAELRRVLVPGGYFVFTVPFRARAARTVTRLEGLPRVGGRLPAEAGGEVHALGWDILELLRAAGFADARAHITWSDELGYLGPFNMIFSAVA
jgi:SAM-dependent methyltransferase